MNKEEEKSKKPLIETHKELLLFLNTLSPKKRSKFIKLLSKHQVDAIAEVFSNFLQNNLTEDKSIINKVKRYQGDIRRIAKKRVSVKQKVKLLSSQRGGFLLNALLPLAASVIGGLLSS